MIDAFISTMIGIIVTAFIAVVAFRLKIRNRGEIMISINTFRANVNALRTAFQTTNIYKVKEPHIIQMVNNLDVECMNLLDELSWYYLFSGKPKRLKEAIDQPCHVNTFCRTAEQNHLHFIESPGLHLIDALPPVKRRLFYV